MNRATVDHMMLHHVAGAQSKMAEMGSARWNFVYLIALTLTLFLPTVSAFDGGDAVALLLGLTISVLGICACLGYYARTRQGV